MKYLSRLAALGCCVCGGEAVIHHIRSHTGLSVRPDDSKAIPLCPNHHNGAEGVHTLGTATWEDRYGSQAGMLAAVHKRLAVTFEPKPSKVLPRSTSRSDMSN